MIPQFPPGPPPPPPPPPPASNDLRIKKLEAEVRFQKYANKNLLQMLEEGANSRRHEFEASMEVLKEADEEIDRLRALLRANGIDPGRSKRLADDRD